MNDFEIMSDSILLIHMWQCDDRPGCYRSCWSSEISGTGDSFEVVNREAAVRHARETGHEVEFIKGTVERIVPLRTAT